MTDDFEADDFCEDQFLDSMMEDRIGGGYLDDLAHEDLDYLDDRYGVDTDECCDPDWDQE